MDDRTFEELKDAYALGALPEEERVLFEEYLASHPERQAEIDDLGGLAGLLALAPPEHEPPADLRRRVMDVVESEAPLPRAARRRPSPIFGRLGDARNVALAAAAALLVGLVSWNILLQGDVRELEGQVEQARAAQEAQQNQNILLRGSWAEQGAHAEVTSLEGDRAVLLVEGVPSIPENQTLQIWVIEGDTPQPSGLLQPADDMAATPITRPIEGADAIAVTVEPAGGSAQPTSDPVLVREL